MIVDKNKLEIAMANSCMNINDLQKVSSIPRPTLNNIIAGKNIRPKTFGKVAKALGVDVTELLSQSEDAV